jgi:ribosomal protein L31
MLMKKVAVTFVALVAAVSAHAQLSSVTTTGTVITSTPSTYDVSFDLTSGSYPFFTGGGGLGFTLDKAADVTFSGNTDTKFSIGSLSGTSLSTPIAFFFTYGVDTRTVDLSAGTYTYAALGTAIFSTAKLYVDVNAVSAIPEPQTYGMLLAGLAVIGVSLRRRRMPVVSRSLAMSC